MPFCDFQQNNYFSVRGSGSRVKGKILVNGRLRSLQEFRKQSCYIRQELSMLQLLTVKETLNIAACFKLSSKTSKSQRARVVDEVAGILGLEGAKNTQVRYLSGGEKKRLSIGVELMNNPPVMFFDEPISGLDSSASLQVMTHLHNLAESGRTVLVIIHQPSSRLFELIDDIYLLSSGKCLYNGPSNDLVTTLSTCGFRCPQYYNRSDFAIEVACGERGEDLESLINEAERQFKQRQGEFYCDSPESQCNFSEDTSEHMAMLICKEESDSRIKYIQHEEIDIDKHTNKMIEYSPISNLQQFYLLYKRCTLCNNRDYQLSHLRIATHIVISILLGLMYYDFGKDADKVIGNFSFVFFNILFIFFASAMPTILTFPVEANVFLQEHLNNWYSLPVYYLAKILSDLPLQIICPSLFLIIGYNLTGQPLEYYRFFMLWLVCVLVAILGQTLGSALGAILDVQLGVFVVPASSIPMFLLSGYFQRPKDLTIGFQYLSYLSYFKYAFEAAILSVFGYNRERLPCSQPYCHYRSLSKFIDDIGVDDFCYWEKINALVLWIFILQISLFCSLKWKIHKSKK
ncbi:ATP-binding cassette sub-family G member 4-like isoform X2 [Lycorma delicatula]|uniref:ATP-binding cassette sub-family G member 4-like isoform X2 n=1 Tax=Lycorma delicatula TaxID=130591 RepID=UPI003F510CAA